MQSTLNVIEVLRVKIRLPREKYFSALYRGDALRLTAGGFGAWRVNSERGAPIRIQY